MRRLTLLPLAALLIASAAAAQTRKAAMEIRPFAGVYVPTGAQHDIFRIAPMVGVQGALELRPNIHLVGELSWVPANMKVATTNDNAHILSQDLGVEMLLVRELPNGWLVKPFAGLGGGIRNFLYRANEFTSRGGPAGYGTLGSELEIGSIALRLEARGHIFRYRPPMTGSDNVTRRDLSVQLGMAYHLR
jgi:hypothetical protein